MGSEVAVAAAELVPRRLEGEGEEERLGHPEGDGIAETDGLLDDDTDEAADTELSDDLVLLGDPDAVATAEPDGAGV